MAHKSITRCVCHKRSFEELQELAGEYGIQSVKEFQNLGIASNGCGLCITYIREMLRTGQTEFEPGEIYKKSSA